MLHRARTTRLARLAAALLAVSLSGAPRLAAPARAAEHRCRCPAGEARHECRCPICAAAAARARDADLDELPPCHRAAARRAQAEGERRRAAAPPAGPCLCSSCEQPGAGDAPPAPEPFVLATPPTLPRGERPEARPALLAAAPGWGAAPEPPPPRSA